VNDQKNTYQINTTDGVIKLQQWFATELGNSVLQIEQEKINKILPNLFGYHILQIGNPWLKNLVDSSRIRHKMIACYESYDRIKGISTFRCINGALPIATDSMDVVVLPHVLEFSSNPHQVLRETERVLIGEGHLLISGFNPWSFWGLWRFFLAWREQYPWNGNYLGLTRLKDWLSLLDFEIIKMERFYFRPPVQNKKIMQKLNTLEQIGRFCWPFLSGLYIVVAKKRVIPLTPVKMQWRSRRRMITSGVTEPSARIMEYRDD